MKTQRGFTLIELMIVVAIIAIPAAIAISQYQDYLIRSQVSEASSLADGVRPRWPSTNNNARSRHAALVRAGQPDLDHRQVRGQVDVASAPGKIVVTFKSAKPTNQKIFGPDPDLRPFPTRAAWNGFAIRPPA